MTPVLLLGSLLSILIITPAEQSPEQFYISSSPSSLGAFALRVHELDERKVGDSAALFGQAAEAFRKKEYDQVLRLLENPALADTVDPEVLNLHGAVLTELKRYDEARPFFARIIEKNPDHFWARFNIAEVDFMAGRYAAARKGFQAMKSDKPSENELLDLKVVMTWLKENNRDEAQKAIEGILGPGRTAAAYAAKAAMAYQSGDKAKARDLLAQARRLFPGQMEGFLDATLADFGMTKETLSGP